ncbi:MAG: quinone oxidoreductase [Pseudomonadota bacterium]
MGEPYQIVIEQTGGPEVLLRKPLSPRAPGPGEVLVRQSAIGLNFIDTYHRSGLYPVKLPFVPGTEGAGEIEAVGPDVNDLMVGDRVAYLGAGTYASHYTGPAARMLKLPDAVSNDAAAAILLKGLTAWMLLFEIRRVEAGEWALIWAPVGGVGTLLLPWAVSLGTQVVAVTSSEAKADKARALGARHVILRDEPVAETVRTLTGGAGVSVSYDSVGLNSAQESLDSLKPRGWWMSYGNASGAAAPVAPGVLGAKGSLILTRPGLFHFIAERGDLQRGAAAVFGALQTGTIKAEIGQSFALRDVADAHWTLEAGGTVGATLLRP